jgi:hypothetical protein
MQDKVSCAKCGNAMDRIGRNPSDIRFTKITFGLYKVKRYLCHACLHEQRIIRRIRSHFQLNMR